MLSYYVRFGLTHLLRIPLHLFVSSTRAGSHVKAGRKSTRSLLKANCALLIQTSLTISMPVKIQESMTEVSTVLSGFYNPKDMRSPDLRAGISQQSDGNHVRLSATLWSI